MRTPTAGHRREFRVNMTPMIDVVFLLIIFFLVSSHLAQQESQLPLPLPVASSGEDAAANETNRVVVNIKSDGTMLLAGRSVGPEQLLARLENESDASRREVEVRVRGDRHVPFEFVQRVLLAISKAGINKVTFAVTERSP